MAHNEKFDCMCTVCRCKVTADLTLTGRTPCTAQCEKCSASINAAFRPCMLHHYSDVLGYLDLQNAAPADLVLQECELTVGCLSCSQEGPAQVTKHVPTHTTHLFCVEMKMKMNWNLSLWARAFSELAFFLSFIFIRTFPMVKPRSSIVNTAMANSVFWLRAQDSSIFSHGPTKQVRAHLHLRTKGSAMVYDLANKMPQLGSLTNVTSHYYLKSYKMHENL